MITFLITTLIIMLALGLVSYVSSKRSNLRTDQTSALSLLPGDIKYDHLLLPDHDINRGQHYPNASSLFVAVIGRNEQTVRRALSEEYKRWQICMRFLRMLRAAKP